eukprot:3055836-Alexandrium_andersonii.AAC.1
MSRAHGHASPDLAAAFLCGLRADPRAGAARRVWRALARLFRLRERRGDPPTEAELRRWGHATAI